MGNNFGMRPTHTLIVTCVCLAATTLPFSSAASAIAVPVSLFLEPPAHPFKAGADVEVTAVIRNISAHNVQLMKIMLAGTNTFEYKVDVWRRQDGKEVEKKTVEKLRDGEIRVQNPAPSGRVGFIVIAPDGLHQDTIVLSDRFKLDHPGRYFVQVERTLPNTLGGSTLTSNKVVIVIAP